MIETVLSLFDGISCAYVALKKAGFNVSTYYSSEIDPHAMEISKKRHKDIIQVGNIKYLTTVNMKPIDLLIGGSPCQDLSIAKKGRQGLKGDRSGLFYEYVRILKEAKPKYFILENVASMPKEARDEISKELGVEPIMINAALVSAQNRKRLFWTNIPAVQLPEDQGIYLKDIIVGGSVDREKSHCIDANYHKGASWEQYKTKGRRQLVVVDKNGKEKLKSNTIRTSGRGSGVHDKHNWDQIEIYQSLTANMGTGGNNVPYIQQTPRGNNPGGPRALDGKTPVLTSSRWESNNKLVDGKIVRKLTPVECERLQGLPDGYTRGVSDTQRYKAVGNAFNADVVAHILTHIKQ